MNRPENVPKEELARVFHEETGIPERSGNVVNAGRP